MTGVPDMPDMPDVPDDRAAFEAERRHHLDRLAGDTDLQQAAVDLFRDADVHHYSYVWDWLGLPIIQTPTDLVAVQEIVWRCKPEVIVETGIARGGSAVFHASLLELVGRGHVVAIDIDIRPHNREAIESHPLAHRITLIEGSSTADDTIDAVRTHVPAGAAVMVVLDSNHTHEHVLRELELYAPMVTPGQYLVVADTIVERLPPNPERPRPWGPGDNPATAVDAFLAGGTGADFERDARLDAKLLVSSSQGGYLRRRPAPASA